MGFNFEAGYPKSGDPNYRATMKNDPNQPPSTGRFSRRQFLKGLGTTAVASAAAGAGSVAAELKTLNEEKVSGPGPQPVTLKINGKTVSLNVEPRVTLLDGLRYHAGITGPKEVCDRATCGACTVLLDGEPVYSCMMLAVDAQGREITTIEGLAHNGKLTKVQEAFIECDALMCGFCTPGFVLGVTALLEKNPHPTEQEVRQACSGNICRCGTQPHIVHAAMKASGVDVPAPAEVINWSDENLA